MIGFIGGIASGIITALGMGGGTVLIIILTVFNNMEQKVAQGVNLVFFIPTAIITIIIFMKQKLIDYKISIPILISGIVGALLGTFIETKIDTNLLKKAFAIFIVLVGLYEIYSIFKDKILNKIIQKTHNNKK